LATLELEGRQQDILDRTVMLPDRIARLDETGMGRPQELEDKLAALGVAASRRTMFSEEYKSEMFELFEEFNEMAF
jgi:hypothetical protein